MRSNLFGLSAIALMAAPTFGAPVGSIVARLSEKYWYENRGETMFSRCEWKKTDGMKLVNCGNVKKVPDGAPVTGPAVGDYEASSTLKDEDVGKPAFMRGHPETLVSVKSYHLALLKHGMTQWMQCVTSPQGSKYFGGQNSWCTTKIKWADIPVGERVMGLGKKGNTTEPPKLPRDLGGAYIGGGMVDKREARIPEAIIMDFEEADPVPANDTTISEALPHIARDIDPSLKPKYDQDATGINFGRYKYINGSSYILQFTNQANYNVTTWEDVPMGYYVYNVGFKSTEDEPEAENPWVDHCAHISCLRCEQHVCKQMFYATIPGTKKEMICEHRDGEGMCDDWSTRENDREGQRRLCKMGKKNFCWNL